MKKLLVITSLFLLYMSVGQAQEKTRENERKEEMKEQKKDRVHTEEHLLFMDGKLYQVRQGERTMLNSEMKLKNGTVVKPDGSYELMNKQRHQLKNGEILDMEGHHYMNQAMFNKRERMHSQMERKEVHKKSAKSKKMAPKKKPATKQY